MVGLAAASEPGLLMHGVHMSMVALGVTGLTVILLPQQLERFRRSGARPRDVHEQRVHELRAQLVCAQPRTHPELAPQRFSHASPAGHGPVAVPSPLELRLLPFVLVAALCSAGAHAAVAPAHLLESPLFGTFFLAFASAQLWWVLALLRGTDRAMLRWAALGNTTVLLVWSTTRLWGLPFGLMPEPEALGPWDLTCAVWEIVVVAGALRLLREPRQGLRPPPLFDWSPSANAWLGASVVVLLLLCVSGAHS